MNTWSPLISSTKDVPPLLNNFASCYNNQTHEVIISGGVDILSSSSSISNKIYVYKCDGAAGNTNCISCTGGNSAWCSTKGRCLSKVGSGYSETCAVPVTAANYCPESVCSSYSTCTECVSNTRCGWCQQMKAYPTTTYGCFEGSSSSPYLGICTHYTRDESKCEALEIRLEIFSPWDEEIIACGDLEYVSWSTFGVIDDDTVKYRCEVTYNDGSREELKKDLSSYGSFQWFIPLNKTGKAQISFYNTKEDEEKLVDTRNVTLIEPKLNILQPTTNEKIITTNYTIKWECPYPETTSYFTPISVSVYKNRSPFTDILRFDDNKWSCSWNIDPSVYPNGEDYYINITWAIKVNNETKLIEVARTGMFSIELPPVSYSFEEVTNETEIISGNIVNITWSSNRFPHYTNIYLMRGSSTTDGVIVECLCSAYLPENTTFQWNVSVEDDGNYYFLAENADNATENGSSDVYYIRRPRVIVYFGDLPETNQGRDRSIGSSVVLNWTYIGAPSTFRIGLESSSSQVLVIKDNIASTVNSYTFSLPNVLINNDIYIVEVLAKEGGTKHYSRLAGNSAPFKVISPGSTPTKSIASVITLSIITLIIIGGTIIFYCFFYKRSRLGGFQQI